MNRQADFQKGVAFINCLLPEAVKAETQKEDTAFRAVAISRQSASGAHLVGEKVARILDRRLPKGASPWTVFDRNLVEKVLEDHHLPDRLARYMPEDAVSHINSIMEELFGLHPPSEFLVQQTSETILRLAKLGRVILLGRAAVLVTAHLPHVLRVRMVAPLEQRIEFMQQTEGLSGEEAAERVHEEDHGRKRYFKKYFHRNDDDPLLYHLVLNTGLISYDETARIIADRVLNQKPAAAAPLPATRKDRVMAVS